MAETSVVVSSGALDGLALPNGRRVNAEKAKTYSAYLQRMYDYIQQHPNVQRALVGAKDAKDAHEVYKGAKQAIQSARYTGDLNALIKNSGASGGASVLGVFVDRFAGMAREQGIELNECALSVAKVATDIGGAGVGSVTSVSGFGLLLLGMSVVSTYQDSHTLATACFSI